MPKVTFVLAEGGRRTVDALLESTVMRTAVANDVPGIVAECGGALSCATCHVYVDEGQLSLLPAPDELELEMLGFTAAERKPNSRLSCQLAIDKTIEDLVVYLPARQLGYV